MATTIGTPFKKNATKAMLLGSGELGREVVIALKRLGLEVIAVDRYENAPAMQIADRSHVVPMLDAQKLEEVILKEKPDFIIPEVEAIATEKLVELEQQGFRVIPTAKAVNLTMNREGIRTLAAETLGLKTSAYAFADNFEDFKKAVEKIGLPCVVKPVMSSSGHGQSIVRSPAQIEKAWKISQTSGRAGEGRVIVESFIPFDYEITLLTVRHVGGTAFCAPIGHQQIDGDYRRSWQPHPMSDKALKTAQDYAKKITDALGGFGIFGVELFIRGDEVYFSEVSPRPHDTGMVTMITQQLSQFTLHVRAILGIPIPEIVLNGPGASRAIVVDGPAECVSFKGLDKALAIPNTDMRIFGKPDIKDHRRMAVLLARGDSIEQADIKTQLMLERLEISKN